MSFYGNISNASRTNLTFDKVYPNRATMDSAVKDDGVMIGRYVLVEYNDGTEPKRLEFFLKKSDSIKINDYNKQLNGLKDSTLPEKEKEKLKEEIEKKLSSINLYHCIKPQYDLTMEEAPEEKVCWMKEDANGGVINLGDIISARLQLNSSYHPVYKTNEEGIPIKDADGNYEIIGYTDPVADQYSVFYFFEAVKSLDEKDKEIEPVEGMPISFKFKGFSSQGDAGWDDYTLNYSTDKKYDNSIGIKFPEQGYDGTIWQKSVVDGEVKYLMIASLNSTMPKITIIPEAPGSMPFSPYLEQKGTNREYFFHYPSAWGFRVKQASGPSDGDIETRLIEYDSGENCDRIVNKKYPADIYFNRSGFEPTKHSRTVELSNGSHLVDNYITILPTKSGKSYPTHNDLKYEQYEDGILKPKVQAQNGVAERDDVQEMSIHLPALGNAVCDIYDLLYGKDRNLSYRWKNTDGTRAVEEAPSGIIFNEDNLHSMAGTINTLHDLIGQEAFGHNTPLPMANFDSVYFLNFSFAEDKDSPFTKENNLGYDGTPGFYRVVDNPVYYPLENNDEYYKYTMEHPDGKGRRYFDLMQFEPDTYYTYSYIKFEDAGEDSTGYLNVYLDRNIVPKSNTEYSPLFNIQALPISLIQWGPYEIDEEGKLPDPLYYVKSKNYIQVTKEDGPDVADREDIAPAYKGKYYNITVEQATYPLGHPETGVKILFYNPSVYTVIDNGEYRHAYSSKNIKDEQGNPIPDENGRIYYKGYFYIDENDKNKLIPVYDMTNDDFRENEEYYYIENYYKGKAQTGEEAGEVDAYYTMIKVQDEETEKWIEVEIALTKENIDKYKTWFEIELINFEPDKYYIKVDNDAFGTTDYHCVRGKEEVKAEGIYYRITDKQLTGDDVVDEETGNIVTRKFYEPKKYHRFFPLAIKDGEEVGNYVIDQNDRMTEEAKYFTNVLIMEADAIIHSSKFYMPGIYYYARQNKETGTIDILKDYSETRTVKYHFDDVYRKIIDREIDDNYIVPEDFIVENNNNELAYFREKDLYVINDEQNIYTQGAKWDKNFAPPVEVKLGIKLADGDKEAPKNAKFLRWQILQGYSKDINTVNGLIVKLNKLLEFSNIYTRDTDTVTGALNYFNDQLVHFANLKEEEAVVVDAYGRLHSTEVKNDSWIDLNIKGWTYYDEKWEPVATEEEAYVDIIKHEDEEGNVIFEAQRPRRKPIPNISLGHADAQPAVWETPTPMLDNHLNFGDTFIVFGMGLDKKRHVTDVTAHALILPEVGVDSSNNGNVLIGIETDRGRGITLEKENVGNLLLTDYKLGTSASVVETDSINSAFGKLQAQLNLLNADASTPGSISNKIFKEVIEADNNDAVDRLTEIADWIVKDETGTAELIADVENNTKAILANKTAIETNLANYEADKILINGAIESNDTDILALQNLVGEKSVETQISEAITAENLAQYALATELDTAEGRITAIEENIENWNKAEENVQSNWLEEDETSDAYIQNKPDLSDVVRTTDLDDIVKLDTTFDYIYSETTTAMTISTLMEKIAELEARIAILETPVSPEPEPEEPAPEPEPEPEVPEEEPTE